LKLTDLFGRIILAVFFFFTGVFQNPTPPSLRKEEQAIIGCRNPDIASVDYAACNLLLIVLR
jgi:hypothetical protein